MPIQNKYERFKLDCLADVEPVDAQSTWTITDSNDESVSIYTSLLPDGTWVYGYCVRWARGQTSLQQPSASLGRFRSQREAKLYAIGFMQSYQSYFLPETRSALITAEGSLLQESLF